MTKPIFTRFKCWEDGRISKVINKEAISIDRKEFLVTHTPFERIRDLKSPERQSVMDEEDFLGELLKRANEDKHTFAVIQGVPGTGKSHLIRWLKERYANQNQNDEVILIARYNSTLKGVLKQIIDSKAFDAAQMKDQLEQLNNAFGHLSSQSLEVNFLNNLGTGTIEEPISELDDKILADIREYIDDIQDNIYYWLLDLNVRNWFLRKGGPVERVRRHLSKDDKEKGLDEDEHPGILPNDLMLDMETRTKIEAGYRPVREFTNRIVDKVELRTATATYLDSLVASAIGRSVSLSSEDLKTIFFELRGNLLRKGKSLAIFIEDITAFTEIDKGLVDVLVAPHTGEGEGTFCRVLSVIGITDDYYSTKFPDNLKARIDIHLTLNSSDDSSAQSNLLLKEDVLAGMVARYLNAIRASDSELDQWFSLQKDLSNIPIRCSSCSFIEACFATFGAEEVQMSRNGQKYIVGLYPFNKQAITTMYENLNQIVIKTPRSLLTKVVEYVLQNHGSKIPEGKFLPHPKS